MSQKPRQWRKARRARRFWRAPAEHIADRAATHCRDTAEQERGKTSQSGVEGARAPGYGKEAQSGSVNHDDRPLSAPADAGSEDHAGNCAGERRDQITRVGKSKRRTLLQDDVAGDAPAERGCQRQSGDAYKIVLVAGVAHCCQRSSQRAHEDAKEVDERKQFVDRQRHCRLL